MRDVEGGPGWRIRGSDLRPEITDVVEFRAGIVGDDLGEGIELLWSGHADQALAVFTSLPDSFRVRALRADCLRDLGKHDESIASFDALVMETVGTPREAVMRQHRGKALFAAGRAVEAAADFERAVMLRANGDPTLARSAEQALANARAAAARIIESDHARPS